MGPTVVWLWEGICIPGEHPRSRSAGEVQRPCEKVYFPQNSQGNSSPTLCCGMMSVQQLYATSLEFLHEALKLLTTKCSPFVKPLLEPGLQEQKFTIELLTAISQKDKSVVEECVFDLLSKRSLSTIGQLAVCQHSSSSWQTKHRFTTRKARLVRGGTRGEEGSSYPSSLCTFSQGGGARTYKRK